MVDEEYAAWVRTSAPGPETAVPARIRYITYAPRTLESSMEAERMR